MKAEKAELVERSGKLGLEYRELQSRNRRQEDFIFDIQAKMDTLEKKNDQLNNQIIERQR